jgi:hypothetical protein
MNYYLSIIPYFGAVNAGIAPNITLKYNPDESVGIYSRDDVYYEHEYLFLCDNIFLIKGVL